jgi:hypothetical protein
MQHEFNLHNHYKNPWEWISGHISNKNNYDHSGLIEVLDNCSSDIMQHAQKYGHRFE